MLGLNFLVENINTIAGFAVVISAIGAFLLYFQNKKGIAQREALTVIREEIEDQSWQDDSHDWYILRNVLGGRSLERGSEKKLKRRLSMLVSGKSKSKLQKRFREKTFSNGTAIDFVHARMLVIRRLNRFEMLGVGIRAGAIDEDMVRMWWGSVIVSEFLLHMGFISAARKTSPKLFNQFHWLAHLFADRDDRRLIEAQFGKPVDTKDTGGHDSLAGLIVKYWHWGAILGLVIFAFLLGREIGEAKNLETHTSPEAKILPSE